MSPSLSLAWLLIGGRLSLFTVSNSFSCSGDTFLHHTCRLYDFLFTILLHSSGVPTLILSMKTKAPTPTVVASAVIRWYVATVQGAVVQAPWYIFQWLLLNMNVALPVSNLFKLNQAKKTHHENKIILELPGVTFPPFSHHRTSNPKPINWVLRDPTDINPPTNSKTAKKLTPQLSE